MIKILVKPSLGTAFEIFEHLSEPMLDINHMFDLSDKILFSTLLIT